MSAISEVLKMKETVVVDVRTAAEFMGGHVAGSVNIPLNEIPQRMDELKRMGKVVLCCASGVRSKNAAMYLKQNGIDCVDGGPWTNVNYHTNN
jgi:phage shock protein E